MNVAFDNEGKIMKVERLNTDKLPDIRTAKNIIQSNVPESSQREQNKAMLKLQEMKSKEGGIKAFDTESLKQEMSDSTANPFSKKARANQTKETGQGLQDIKPNYGVRTRK